MEIFNDTTLLGGIIGLFQIKKSSNCMSMFYKTLTDISLQSDQMVCGTFAFLKTTLIFSYYIIVLQEPYETMIDHALHDFAKTTCPCYRPVIIRIRCVLFQVWGQGLLLRLSGHLGNPEIAVQIIQE